MICHVADDGENGKTKGIPHSKVQYITNVKNLCLQDGTRLAIEEMLAFITQISAFLITILMALKTLRIIYFYKM